MCPRIKYIFPAIFGALLRMYYFLFAVFFGQTKKPVDNLSLQAFALLAPTSESARAAG